MLQSMGSQSVGHNGETEEQQEQHSYHRFLQSLPMSVFFYLCTYVDAIPPCKIREEKREAKI